MKLQLSKANHSLEICLRYGNYEKLEVLLHKLDQRRMAVHFLESSLVALADVLSSPLFLNYFFYFFFFFVVVN